MASNKGEIQSVEQAMAMARAGEPAAARLALVALLEQRPADAEAWFWLACVTTSPWEAWSSLRKVLELRPAYPGASAALEWVQGEIAAGRCLEPLRMPYVPPEPAPRPAPERRRPWPALAGAALIVILAAGLVASVWFGWLNGRIPTLDAAPPAETGAPAPTATATRLVIKTAAPAALEEAWAKGDWPAAIAILEALSAQEPANSAWRMRRFDAHVRLGNEYAERGLVEEALAQYDAALALRPYDAELQQARGAAARYLSALERYQAGDWAAAAEALQAVYQQEGDYRDTRDLLYSVHYNLGLAYHAAGQLDAAEREWQAARPFARNPLAIEQKLAELRALKTPPTPTPSPKRIVVDISEQRFYAYEADRLVYKFVCSTGSNASPTAPGSYRVLDKIPMAYASTWNLKMPYWLGIYWSGTLENGIHALPILSNGRILWDGYLGQRVSFGCVILSTQDAKTIFEWADIGTPVIIRP